jgi:hypothetical protein
MGKMMKMLGSLKRLGLKATAGAVLVGLCMPGASQAAYDDSSGNSLSANWIWKARTEYKQYNDTIVARRSVMLPEVTRAHMRITADSYYRLYINDEWVNDGPCRSWPAHYQYDVLDVTSYLRKGKNEIRVVAKFFGIGTFHQVPQQAGFLAQLDARSADGEWLQVVTDDEWEVADAPAWLSNTPKQSVQMGPFEVYDARLAKLSGFEPAVVLFSVEGGPWKDLNPRDCPLLTREPFAFRDFVGANVVEDDWLGFIFPTAQMMYPGVVVKSNNHNSMASAVATIVSCPEPMTLEIVADGQVVTIDGAGSPGNRFELAAGDHFLFSVLQNFFGHWNSDTQLRFRQTEGFTLVNPMDENSEHPWCFVPFEDGKLLLSDVEYALMDAPQRQEIQARIEGAIRNAREGVRNLESFKDLFAGEIETVEAADDIHNQFQERSVIAPATGLVANPSGLMYDNAAATIVSPSPDGDVELVYDLGEQNCGYYQFEIVAEEGLTLDFFGVEYITPEGRVQHTGRYRNGMRYICREGVNKFTSLARRSQRYLFITLRNQTKPAQIRNLRLVESTYPVVERGWFACSDERLSRIWDISARTLKLCMEDSFTDCPLYEQTLWVGDARNESVFGYTAFGSDDLAKRCIVLAGQSLEQFPITLCQVPSTWETLLPAWSFLWGISVWDNYQYSGDKEFLRRVWPWVIRNLQGASKYVDDHGLFSGPFWNMFDWSGSDQGHNTVLHNSMFVVGAIDSALNCAEVLGDHSSTQWLKEYRQKTVDAVNAMWDDDKGAYPDSIHGDGKISDRTSIHTSFLSLLYDIVEDKNREQVIENMLNPPDAMVKVGSPFAIMYLYEALEKAGYQDQIVQNIYESYLPMLEHGATTVWESFSTGTTGSGGFPTRSHTHAWSSAPIHFLNRIILGILPQEAGGRTVAISPRLNGLTWAKGATATVRGDVTVAWEVSEEVLNIDVDAPEGIILRFEPNETHAGLTVVFNGEKVK